MAFVVVEEERFAEMLEKAACEGARKYAEMTAAFEPLLTKKQLQKEIGALNHNTWQRAQKANKFPQPVEMHGQTSMYRLSQFPNRDF